MSRSRPPTPLPDGLPEAVRVLLTELRELKERSGYDLRALERRTHASRSSWGRWLSGETWIPADAVRSLADLCGADRRRLEILWEVADQSRRPPSPAPTSEKDTEPSADAPAETDAGRDVQRRGRRRMSFAGAVVGCALVAGSAGVVLGVTLQGTPVAGDDGRQSAPSGEATRPQVEAVTRQQAMARTRAWHPHTPKRVPYDQTANYGGYRTDGSGYASMVLGLPKPGPNSAALEASYCRRVRQSALRPGDLVIKASGGADVREVLIFEKWTSREHTAYWAYQQRRGYGTDHLVSREGLAPGSGHEGCRPYNLHDDQVG